MVGYLYRSIKYLTPDSLVRTKSGLKECTTAISWLKLPNFHSLDRILKRLRGFAGDEGLLPFTLVASDEIYKQSIAISVENIQTSYIRQFHQI